MLKSRHSKQQVPAVSDAEYIARYRHLVELLPDGVSLKAHAAAVAGLSSDQATTLLDQLRRSASADEERNATSEAPDVLTMLVHDAGLRDEMMRTEVAALVASQFVHSAPVAAYFSGGLGSLTIETQPAWVNALANHETSPIDAGNLNHEGHIDHKLWGW